MSFGEYMIINEAHPGTGFKNAAKVLLAGTNDISFAVLQLFNEFHSTEKYVVRPDRTATLVNTNQVDLTACAVADKFDHGIYF